MNLASEKIRTRDGTNILTLTRKLDNGNLHLCNLTPQEILNSCLEIHSRQSLLFPTTFTLVLLEWLCSCVVEIQTQAYWVDVSSEASQQTGDQWLLRFLSPTPAMLLLISQDLLEMRVQGMSITHKCKCVSSQLIYHFKSLKVLNM